MERKKWILSSTDLVLFETARNGCRNDVLIRLIKNRKIPYPQSTNEFVEQNDEIIRFVNVQIRDSERVLCGTNGPQTGRLFRIALETMVRGRSDHPHFRFSVRLILPKVFEHEYRSYYIPWSSGGFTWGFNPPSSWTKKEEEEEKEKNWKWTIFTVSLP